MVRVGVMLMLQALMAAVGQQPYHVTLSYIISRLIVQF
jgi:hypothetical protein